MEKSGCLQITSHQLDLVKNGDYSSIKSIMASWGISSIDEIKAIIDSGQYQIVESN